MSSNFWVWPTTTAASSKILPQSPSHYTSSQRKQSSSGHSSHKEAFDQLRRRLTSAPVLAFPDYTNPFLLDTDASDTGLGAVLSQADEQGREHVIAYASRTLSKAERHYCVTRKELLAVVTFIHHFRPYLIGRQFTLRTDHGCLRWLSNFKQPEGQLARWLKKLQEYQFEVVHRRGRNH